MFFIEAHHAIGLPPGAALSDYRWERIALGDGADAGYADLADPRLAETRDRLLTHPAIAGVRVVFEAAAPEALAMAAEPAPLADGQIVMEAGR
jgi:hypothetical protein